MKPIKLNIGCGKRTRPGYINCDVRPLPGVDMVCRADDLLAKTGSVAEVYSRHTLEHFTLREALTVLAEWNRVLKVGGRLHLIMPNLLWHCHQMLEGEHESLTCKERGANDRYWALGSLFGWQQDEFDVHKCGWYFEMLADCLEELGFGDVTDLTNPETPWHLEVEAVKTNQDPVTPQETSFWTLLDVEH